MPVVALNSTVITNRNASPPTQNPQYLSGGTLQRAVATFELTNNDSIGSTYRICELPRNASIHSIRIFCDAVTSAAGDLGLYQTTANGGAVKAVSCYATAQSIASAITLGTEIMFEFRDIANLERRVWQDAGDSADPGRNYDLVFTLTAASTAAGTLSFMVVWAEL